MPQCHSDIPTSHNSHHPVLGTYTTCVPEMIDNIQCGLPTTESAQECTRKNETQAKSLRRACKRRERKKKKKKKYSLSSLSALSVPQ